MATELPTEEDVLAFLVLHSALCDLKIMASSQEWLDIDDAIENWEDSAEYSDAAKAVSHARMMEHGALSAAIADSERRLEVERAREAVVQAALAVVDGDPFDFAADLQSLRVRVEALRALAEVSRHGG